MKKGKDEEVLIKLICISLNRRKTTLLFEKHIYFIRKYAS